MGLFLCISCGHVRRQEREVLRRDQCMVLLDMANTLTERVLNNESSTDSLESIHWFEEQYDLCLEKHPISH